MLSNEVANAIRNELQNNMHNISWNKYHYTNVYLGDVTNVTIDDITYNVIPYRSYNTVVAFLHFWNFYEVGKYSRTTSKQVTQIYNEFYGSNTIMQRVFVPLTR